jgi:hypothetical protein
VNHLRLFEALDHVTALARSYDAQAVSFCLAARIMSLNVIGTHQNILDARAVPETIRQRLLGALRQPLYASAGSTLSSTSHSAKELAARQRGANAALGMFHFELCRALAINSIRIHNNFTYNPAASTAFLPPPSSFDIPFLSFMDLPLPFSSDAAKEFGLCHLRTMTRPEFLEDGEWAGYYCYSSPTPRVIDFDAPMLGIRFVTRRSNVNSTTLGLSAAGVDSIGGFSLHGEIDVESGVATMRKQYVTGTAWDWHCVMTPFGIVGSWGRQRFGGWFWLWKANWASRNLVDDLRAH